MFLIINFIIFLFLKIENAIFLLIIKKLPFELILIIILLIFLTNSSYTLLITKCFQMLCKWFFIIILNKLWFNWINIFLNTGICINKYFSTHFKRFYSAVFNKSINCFNRTAKMLRSLVFIPINWRCILCFHNVFFFNYSAL